MTEIRCCAQCKFVGKQEYHGAHVWCQHPKAKGLSLPNRNLGIHHECPIRKFTIVRHVEGEYVRNVLEYCRLGEVEEQLLKWQLDGDI